MVFFCKANMFFDLMEFPSNLFSYRHEPLPEKYNWQILVNQDTWNLCYSIRRFGFCRTKTSFGPRNGTGLEKTQLNHQQSMHSSRTIPHIWFSIKGLNKTIRIRQIKLSSETFPEFFPRKIYSILPAHWLLHGHFLFAFIHHKKMKKF